VTTGRVLGDGTAVRLSYEAFLALRYLRFHRGRTFLSVITLISVGGVAVGTAALVIALALNAGFVADVRERIHSGSAHLTVLDAEQEFFEGGAALATLAGSVPGVQATAQVLHTPAMLTAGTGASPGYVELEGIEPERHARVILGPAAGGGAFAALEHAGASGRTGIVLGEDLALKLGVVEGDLVRALVPRVTLSPSMPVPRSQVFEVVATYSSDHFMEDSHRAYITLEAARHLMRLPGRSSWLEIRLDDLRQLAAMKSRLRAALPERWLVIDLMEQNRDLLKALNTEKLALFLAIGLIVVVAALNIVSTLILMVADKTKEIGTLTAMGATPAGIARVFMFQGCAIGVVGTTAGLCLGVAVSWWLDHYRIIKLDPDVYYLTYLPFLPQATDLLAVGTAAILISFVATLYPAAKAARLDPVEAIRHE